MFLLQSNPVNTCTDKLMRCLYQAGWIQRKFKGFSPRDKVNCPVSNKWGLRIKWVSLKQGLIGSLRACADKCCLKIGGSAPKISETFLMCLGISSCMFLFFLRVTLSDSRFEILKVSGFSRRVSSPLQSIVFLFLLSFYCPTHKIVTVKMCTIWYSQTSHLTLTHTSNLIEEWNNTK